MHNIGPYVSITARDRPRLTATVHQDHLVASWCAWITYTREVSVDPEQVLAITNTANANDKRDNEEDELPPDTEEQDCEYEDYYDYDDEDLSPIDFSGCEQPDRIQPAVHADTKPASVIAPAAAQHSQGPTPPASHTQVTTQATAITATAGNSTMHDKWKAAITGGTCNANSTIREIATVLKLQFPVRRQVAEGHNTGFTSQPTS